MITKQDFVREYLNQAQQLDQHVPGFFTYASTILTDNKGRVEKFQKVVKKRNIGYDQAIDAIKLMAAYNALHFKAETTPYQHSPGAVNEDLECIMLAGGEGTRFSMMGADRVKPLMEVPEESGFKGLMDYTLDEITTAGYGKVIVCGNNATKAIQDHIQGSAFSTTYIPVYTKSKKEAMQEALQRIDPKTKVVLRSCADTYRADNLTQKATEYHLSLPDPDNKMTIIYKKVDPATTGLSTNVFTTDGPALRHIERIGDLSQPAAEGQFFGLKLGTLIGRNLISLMSEHADKENNNTYNAVARLKPGSVVLYNAGETNDFGVDDPFDMTNLLAVLFPNQDPAEVIKGRLPV